MKNDLNRSYILCHMVGLLLILLQNRKKIKKLERYLYKAFDKIIWKKKYKDITSPTF